MFDILGEVICKYKMIKRQFRLCSFFTLHYHEVERKRNINLSVQSYGNNYMIFHGSFKVNKVNKIKFN